MLHTLWNLTRRTVDPSPKKEQILPQLSAKVGGQIGQTMMDLVVHDGVQRLLLDVTIVSPYAGDANFRAACARRDGHAARRAAVAKHAKYESEDLVPFALETGGRLGTEARAYLRRLAQSAEDPNAEMLYLYKAVSVTLQSGVARQLLQS
jgi:hypothetical protein